MATLSVLRFDNPEGAEQALQVLRRLEGQHLIQLLDAAVVSWPHGRKAPKTKQAFDTRISGALGGGFWGFLFGLIFFVPLLGMAVGAAAGALTGSLTDYGISDNFIRQTRDKVTPGTSALFLMSKTMAADRVVGELRNLNPELVTTNLSTEQEDRLRELFADAQVPV